MLPPKPTTIVQPQDRAYVNLIHSVPLNSSGLDAVKNWSEDQVCKYLRIIKYGKYEKLFKKHNINGGNLVEIDKEILKGMGIEKVGDRVRLYL